LLTSGAAYAAIPRRETLASSAVLTMHQNFENDGAGSVLKITKFGTLMFIEGTLKVKTLIPVSTGTNGFQMFTINTTYRPRDFTSVNCSTNFMTSGSLAKLDCAATTGIAEIQTDIELAVGTFVNINFVYFIG
jgi:hypothetical protein